jgi:hypothetical protein
MGAVWWRGGLGGDGDAEVRLRWEKPRSLGTDMGRRDMLPAEMRLGFADCGPYPS